MIENEPALTVHTARKLLLKPAFGNLAHIDAVKVLEALEECVQVLGKVNCKECRGEGTSFKNCPTCGHETTRKCSTCRGSGDLLKHPEDLTLANLEAFLQDQE